MDYILARLREASTWAGIAIFLGMFGLDADLVTRITSNAPAIFTAIASLAAIFLPARFPAKTVATTTTRT